MTGWAKDQGTTGSLIKLLGDPRLEFTKALGDSLVLDAPGAMAKLGNPRCERFSMFVDDGVIKTLKVAGQGGMEDKDTMVDAMLADIKGSAAALQYPMEPPASSAYSTGGRSAGVQASALPKPLSLAQRFPVAEPSKPYPSLPNPLASTGRGVPSAFASARTAQRSFAGPRLYEELPAQDSDDVMTMLSALLFGFFSGSAITCIAFRFRRRILIAAREPLLNA